MHVGFEASDLDPRRGGLYTYASQLLRRLRQLDDPPILTLIDAGGRQGRQGRQGPEGMPEGDEDLSPATGLLGVRPWPLLSSIEGPWRRYRYARYATSLADHHFLRPLWERADDVPLLARWHLPRRPSPPLDLCHWPFEGTFIRLPGAAHVATIHDLIPLRHPAWLAPAYVAAHTANLRAIARHATRLIAVSEHTRRDILDLLGVPPERIDVIPEAAGPAFAPPARAMVAGVLARHGLREGDYILSWGIISERKNPARLAAAFARAIDQHPDMTTRLVLAGDWGWRAEPIKEGLAALGLGARLLMPGHVPREDLPALIHGARAVAYVSLYEGFGLPPLEAMACGTPVVASDVSSIPEVTGDAALLVDPYKVEDIAAALGRMLTDDALRAELAARGLRRAAQFSWQRTAELTMDTYRRTLAAHRQTRAKRQ